MYWLVETEEQLESFSKNIYDSVFIELVLYNDLIHPSLNNISLIYIKPFINDKGYMLCITHDETLSLNKTVITSILRKYNTIYVRDKKLFLNFFQLQNIVDVSFQFDNLLLPNTKIHELFYNKNGMKEDLNLIIPISKHYEKCEMVWDKIKEKCFIPINNSYLNKLSIIFSLIESNGIKINKNNFDKNFKLINESRSLLNNIIYTNYNLHTTTGRPSNSFNGINFSALKKDNGCRESFIAKNDYLIEYDITSYHPTLLSNIINFNFGNESPYEYFAREAHLPIESAKVEFIKQMYGGVFKKYKKIDFFCKMEEFVNSLWEEFQKTGKIECKKSGKIFYKEKLHDMNPGKLLSYYIQDLETSNNVDILWEILKILRKKETQLVLYNYDSFCLDFKSNELFLTKEIENIFVKKNLKFKIKKGVNYNFTEKIKYV